jgi:hypothetical protein
VDEVSAVTVPGLFTTTGTVFPLLFNHPLLPVKLAVMV